jgi:hypothetical protein
MTDHRQTSRDSATSARSKTFRKAARCQRCAEIEATPDEDMLLFSDPSKPPPSLEDQRAEGRRIKSLAYAMHADAGHPTEADYHPPKRHDYPIIFGPPPSPRRQWITLHGIGWLVNLIVGLLTIWLVAHGGHL